MANLLEVKRHPSSSLSLFILSFYWLRAGDSRIKIWARGSGDWLGWAEVRALRDQGCDG